MILHLDGIINARELGGLKTMDGKTVSSNLLFRTANLNGAASTAVRKLCLEYQIKHVVDFRDIFECVKSPDVVIPYAKYHFLPVLPPLFEDGENTEEKRAYYDKHPDVLFEKIYDTMASNELAEAAYKGFFEVLLKANGEAVLWHCTQGKDRTGIAALLLLTVLKVPKENIFQEYMLTNEEMQKEFEQMRKDSEMPSDRLRFMQEILFVKKENLQRYCDHIESQYGSLYTYITEKLISEDDAERLRKVYLS